MRRSGFATTERITKKVELDYQTWPGRSSPVGPPCSRPPRPLEGLEPRARRPSRRALFFCVSAFALTHVSDSHVKQPTLRRPDWMGAGAPRLFSAPLKKRGEQSADRRWCGAPHPMTRLAIRPISGSLGDHRPNDADRAPFGALLRRSHSGVGPRFRQRACDAVSQLLAGDRCVPGRSPDAARVRACDLHPRAPHQPRPGIAGRRLPESMATSPVPPPACPRSRRLMSAPLSEQGPTKIRPGLEGGDKFFSRELSPLAVFFDHARGPCGERVQHPGADLRILAAGARRHVE